MENATNALKMAAAMLMFVGALSITIIAFSKSRQASASVMARSEKNKTYYSIDNPTSEKEVGIDTVIYNLYSYYQTQDTILFYSGRKVDNQVSVTGKITLYQTDTLDKKDLNGKSNLDKSTLISDGNRGIFGLDINDEIIRQEPWAYDGAKAKQFVDALINKVDSPEYDWSRPSAYNLYNSETHKLKMRFIYNMPKIIGSSSRFLERIGEYNYETKSETTSTQFDGGYTLGQFSNPSKSSATITFNENDEEVDNSKGNKKRVIEYIYIGN